MEDGECRMDSASLSNAFPLFLVCCFRVNVSKGSDAWTALSRFVASVITLPGTNPNWGGDADVLVERKRYAAPPKGGSVSAPTQRQAISRRDVCVMYA
eukprot:scaffold9380_cov111-Isochrysis_galbana.AAC.1